MARFSEATILQAMLGCRARQRDGDQTLGRAQPQEISAMRTALALGLTSQDIPHNNFKPCLF